MITFYDPMHKVHDPKFEFYRGNRVPCFESPQRCELIRDCLQATGLSDFRQAEDVSSTAIQTIHDTHYLDFLKSIHQRWCAELIEGGEAVADAEIEIIPHTFPARNLLSLHPRSIYGEVGYYAMDTASPITSGAYAATHAASRCAINAVQAVFEGRSTMAFSLSRPPGHHASRDSYGGYCFLNHAAVAAQHWLDLFRKQDSHSQQRITILDVDFHHGNGTQSIFYQRSDVQFISLHADPAVAYPYFLGAADETGAGDGVGFNLNYPLPLGTPWQRYQETLSQALGKISDYHPAALVVSFGADTHQSDPISGFRLGTENFKTMGAMIAGLKLPTAVVMEGGYAKEILGQTVAQFLSGLKESAN